MIDRSSNGLQTRHEGRNALRWLLLVAALMFGGVIVLALLGRQGFVWKTAVVPALALVALLSRRTRAFVSEWGPFLGCLALFDVLRGLIYAAITRFELPVYAGYVVSAEKRLLGGEVLPTYLQTVGQALPFAPAFERLLVVVHASHFVVFLFYGLLLWLLHAEGFLHFRRALLLLLLLGLLGYVSVPTLPPWYAYERFELLPPLRHVSNELYRLAIPTLLRTFDTNPIAAMPSLHFAIPLLVTLSAFSALRGRLPWLVAGLALYTALVGLAAAYLAEHYLLDLMAGGLVAVLAFRLTAGPATAARGPTRGGWPQAVLLTLALTLAALLLSELSTCWLRAYRPSASFVARELKDRAIIDFYQTARAFDRSNCRSVETTSGALLAQLESQRLIEEAAFMGANCALRRQDFRSAARFLPQVPEGSVTSQTLAAVGLWVYQAGDQAGARRLLAALDARGAKDAAALYWRGVLGYDMGVLSTEDLGLLAERLRARGERYRPLAAELRRRVAQRGDRR